MNSLNLLTLALLILLQFADAWTTTAVLLQGGRELWAPTAWLMERIGVAPALTLGKAVLIGFAIELAGYEMASIGVGVVPTWWILGAMCLLYAWVVWHNAGQIRR